MPMKLLRSGGAALALLVVFGAAGVFGSAHAQGSLLTRLTKRDYLIVNQAASGFGLDQKALDAVWKDEFPPQLGKLYPPRRWGFLAVIDGGIDARGLCVVTARASMLPRSGKVLQFKPLRSAVTFDAQADLTREKCTALAAAKLDEAIEGMLQGIVAGK